MIYENNLFKIIIEIILIVSLFCLYGFLHSLLASNKVKLIFQKYFPFLFPYFRLMYNIFAIASFIFIVNISPKPDVIVYDLAYPFDIIIFFFQFISLIGIIWTLKYFDAKEFFGITQIKNWIKNRNGQQELNLQSELNRSGPYKFSRHPLYFFIILFLMFRPTMNLFYLLLFLCISAYFYIGSFFEEKKLIEQYGEKYLNYQKQVPRIFPFKFN